MRKTYVIMVGVLLVFAGSCAQDEGGENITAASPDTSAPAASEPGGGECTDLTGQASGAPIEMMDSPFRFDPDCAIIKTTQGFSITNNGAVTHNFSIENVAAVDVDTAPGQTNNYDAPGLQAGTFMFFCKFHRASGMEGELRVS